MILDFGYRAVVRLFGFDWGGGHEGSPESIFVPVCITATFDLAGSSTTTFNRSGTQGCTFSKSGTAQTAFTLSSSQTATFDVAGSAEADFGDCAT